jgi:2-polyprenyl-3-methyl-5-hydroxy-6-metoxy-1,4-benzoquinol methylase
MKLGITTDSYQEAIRFLKPYITRDVCKKIAVLDISMDPDRPFDFVSYLERSAIRYDRIFRQSLISGAKWLEIGCLFPAFPIALSLMGMNVSIVEDFSFYPSEIHQMYAQVSNTFGIRFLNHNLSTQEDMVLPDRYDYASLLGVLEHLPHTPRFLLENIHLNLNSNGILYVDVPNLYFSFNIQRFMKGQHIQQPIATLYRSGIPFVGHHREYSVTDLRFVLGEAGFRVKGLELFNYSTNFSLRRIANPSLLFHLLSQMPSFRELIFVECQKQ